MRSYKITTRFKFPCVVQVIACATLLIIVSVASNFAHAQRIQRIAATVNDDIISEYDLQARMKVVIASSGLRPTPKLQRRLSQQVLRTLIDEQLQLQEAKKRNIRVTKRDLSLRIAVLEKQNKIPPGAMDSFVKKLGIPRDALMDQIRAQISWQKLVRRFLLPRVTVGDDEVDDILKSLQAKKGQVEYRVSEILLTVNQPEQEDEVRRTAQRLLEELGKGAKFSAISRQFSQAASASVGGDLGWIQEATMNSDLRQIVSRMKEGETAGPIRSLAGMQIIQLDKKRRIFGASTEDSILELQQILLPLRKGMPRPDVKAQENLARILSDTVSGCEDHLRAAREAKSAGSTKLGKIRLGNLSKTIRASVENLSVGEASSPVRTGSGVAVFMVCSRKEPPSGLPDRDQIANKLRDDRIDVLARRFLRDLRAAAVVDLRI